MRMMDELKCEIKKYEDLSKNDNANHFLDVCEAIILLKDPASIPFLLGFFDDDTEYSWVFESIRKNLEIFDDENYVTGLLKFLNITAKKNKEWLKCFFYTILNSENCLILLKKNISLAPRNKLFDILQSIATESDHHAAIIEELEKET